MFLVFGHDNGLTFFEDRDDVHRCDACRQLLAKWDEDLTSVAIPHRLKYDVSTSYDGVVVVSRRFRDLYETSGMTGLRFISLANGAFTMRATQTVLFNANKRGTRFEDKCATCGQFESVAGATPAVLMEGQSVNDMAFARTDIEFGSGDEKGPLLICGTGAANALRSAKLKGMDLEEVERA